MRKSFELAKFMLYFADDLNSDKANKVYYGRTDKS